MNARCKYLETWYPESPVQSFETLSLWYLFVRIKCSFVHCILMLNLKWSRVLILLLTWRWHALALALLCSPEVLFWLMWEDRGNIWQWRMTSWTEGRTSSCPAFPILWLWCEELAPETTTVSVSSLQSWEWGHLGLWSLTSIVACHSSFSTKPNNSCQWYWLVDLYFRIKV